MNLNEECLLKYLLNPSGISDYTDILKLSNKLIEKELKSRNTSVKIAKQCPATRV